MIREAIDFRFLLLENYKKLRISEAEFATILMIDKFINDGNDFITADLLSLKMSLDTKDIDKVLSDLLIKGFLEYKTINNKTVCSLDSLKEKLYHEFQISFSSENDKLNKDVLQNDQNDIKRIYEELLNRELSPIEVNKINEWLIYGYSKSDLVNALKDCVKENKKSLRYIEKQLLKYSIREDRESEGHSPISDDWDLDLKETIRIAKTPWINKDENGEE